MSEPKDPRPQILGLGGYGGGGKDTFAAFLTGNHGWERLAFADAIRSVLWDLNPLVESHWVGGHLQDVVKVLGWEDAKRKIPQVRLLLQRMGVAMRDLDPDTWVRLVMRQIQPQGKYVITDVRFPNEIAAVKRAGGTTAWVLRGAPLNDHVSEAAVRPTDFDLLVDNMGSIAALEQRAAELDWRLRNG